MIYYWPAIIDLWGTKTGYVVNMQTTYDRLYNCKWVPLLGAIYQPDMPAIWLRL